MTRRALSVVAIVLAVAAVARAMPVRFFAVGNKQRLVDGTSYQTFHDKMAALMDATFPNRGDFVQVGVDDVASHLRPADPAAPDRALVVFPEDVGLVTVLIGSRGAAARGQTTAAGAIASLLGPYTAQFDYYAGKFPDQPLVRTLVLALTDTLYRSFYETFRELAITHGVYLAATINAAPARRVEDTIEPERVALLRDPDEPARQYAYEAVSPLAVNTTFIFTPMGDLLVSDGEGGTRRSPAETGGVLAGATKKAYLTPIEEPPPGEAAGLALAFGPVRDLDVLDTPVGRLGVVISKDAWMVDVNDRLAAKGANVILQPEAFSEWAYAPGPWQPDIFKEGGFATLQKVGSFLLNVDASMTGNFLDVTFDGQSAIIGRKRKTDPGPLGPANAWIGQNPDGGFLALAPWIEPDPDIAAAGLGLAARRTLLAGDGAILLPGSGVPCPGSLAAGACENGYREAIVWADADIPDSPVTAPVDPVRTPPPHFRPSVRVSGDEPVPVAQHAPRVAASGPRVYVVWYEARAGLDNVFLAVSRNRGATFGAPRQVSDNPPGAVEELHPVVAARGNRVVVAWQEFVNGRDADLGRITLAYFDGRGRKVGHDVQVDDPASGGKWLPAVALVGATPIVVWVDERDGGPEGEPLEHVYAARADPTGRAFAPAVRVDGGAPVPLALHLDNKWAPTITVAGRSLYVAWADFRNYNWDIFLARSDDGGRSFGPNVEVDDFPDLERLDERPAIAADRRGHVHVVWTDLRAREPDTNIFYARSDDRGTTFSTNRPLDGSRLGFDVDRSSPTNQWHPSLAMAHGKLFVAWQDNRLGNDDIFLTTSADGGATFAPAERVDDTGAGASEQTRPHLALGGRRRCYVVWEDDRNGTTDIYLGRRICR